MTLDPETLALVTAVRAVGAPRLHESTPEQARAGMRARRVAAAAALPPVESSVDTIVAAADGASLPIRVITPSQARDGVIVYVHGGGWVVGENDDFEAVARGLALATRMTVVMAGYRLAPEHPFPGPLDDVWATLQWASDRTGSHLPEGPLVIAGDSAGGNLATVVAARASRQGVRLAAQVLMYPVTDYDLDTVSYLDPENQLIIDRLAMAWCWEQYVPDPARRTDPEASPLRAAIPRDLAPAVVVTAEHDVLRDEGESYVERLRAAGIPVGHRRFDGQMHAFLGNPALPGSAVALRFIGDELARALAE